LTARNCLAVLKGAFLNVEVTPAAAAPPVTQRVSIALSGVSTYLGNHLIRLGAGKEIKGLVPVQCKATGCLFVPAGALRALIHLDGPEIGEKALREKLDWKGGQNAYGTFAVLVDHHPLGDEMPQPAMGPERWKNIYGDDTSKFGLKVSEWPDAEMNFSRLEPDQFASPEEKVGANVKQLPKPSLGSDPGFAERPTR